MAAGRNSLAGIAVDGNRIFIARRKNSGALGGKWEFPGGKAEPGESLHAALIREYMEEFALAVRVGRHIGSSSFEHSGRLYNLHAYRIFFETPLSNIQLNEHSEFKWALLSEIQAMDFAASDRALLPMLESYLEGERGIN